MENEFIYIKQSNIPNAGFGCFTKCNIQKGAHIANYKGYMVDQKKLLTLSQEERDRSYCINNDLFIIGSNIGSKINDNINFTKYTFQEFENAYYNKQLL